MKQESAAHRSDGIQVVESIDLTDELPPARSFAETEDTKACPKCAHAVLIEKLKPLVEHSPPAWARQTGLSAAPGRGASST